MHKLHLLIFVYNYVVNIIMDMTLLQGHKSSLLSYSSDVWHGAEISAPVEFCLKTR